MSKNSKNKHIIPNRLRQEAENLRNKLPAPYYYTGNVGVAYVNINDVPRIIRAHSGINQRMIHQSLGIFAPLRHQPYFKTVKVANDKAGKPYNRNVDTEAKILEEIAWRIDYNHLKRGNIVLYTEKQPCHSCKGIIEQFKNRFTLITLSVYYG